MNAITLEWIDIAEGDFATCGRELRARKHPNFISACYHAHQCAEKYLKAFLHESGTLYPKTHNLIVLLDLCKSVDGTISTNETLLVKLNPFAVDIRYPGNQPDRQDARNAYMIVKSFRSFMRVKFGMSPK